jgi:general secretion pathway protein H
VRRQRRPGQLADGVILRSARAQPGFTLLEILVVIVIIGVMVSMATLSIGVLGADREVKEEAERFWAVLRQAREEAELQAIDVAIFVGQTDYEFLRFDTRRNEWTPIVEDKLYAQRTLPEGLRFRLWLENREIVLKPGLPDRSKKDESQKWPPQITVLSSGDVVPFEMHIERDAAPALWRVTSLADSDLRLEQRKDERDWVVVAQTKPPPEDDRNKERVSDARR